MTWENRLRPAAYTSPGGTRISFEYENVSLELDKKTAAFNFVDVEGTFIQDNGASGRRYPLRVIFSGSNHDLSADAFVDALSETGDGVLEHPRYGRVTVVPFGKIGQRDDLKSAANQTIIEVTFFATIGLVYPSAQVSPLSAVLSAINDFNTAVSNSFGALIDLSGAYQIATFTNDFVAIVGSVSSTLGAIANVEASVRSQFDTIVNSITSGMDVLVGEPGTLAAQTAIMTQTPGKSTAGITEKLANLDDLTTEIVSDSSEITGNQFQTRDLYALSYTSAAVVAAINSDFITRTEALAAADDILAQLEGVVAWRDEKAQELGLTDTGESYQALQSAVALGAGYLVALSFSLKQEHSIVLDRSRTIVDLSAELYGEVDAKLDFLINTNNLSGSEILEIPRGREIVYYI